MRENSIITSEFRTIFMALAVCRGNVLHYSIETLLARNTCFPARGMACAGWGKSCFACWKHALRAMAAQSTSAPWVPC